jgi:hypothetical protein
VDLFHHLFQAALLSHGHLKRHNGNITGFHKKFIDFRMNYAIITDWLYAILFMEYFEG